MLTKVEHIVAAAHRDLQYCMNRPTTMDPDRVPKPGQSVSLFAVTFCSINDDDDDDDDDLRIYGSKSPAEKK